MGKYRVIIEVEDRTNAEASVKRYFQKMDDHGRWKALDLSSCDSVPAYVVYDRVSKGVGCFKTRDVMADVGVMLTRAIIAAVGYDLGDDIVIVADRLEHEFSDRIKAVAERYISYAQNEGSPLIATLVRHFLATLDYTAFAEMIIGETKEMYAEFSSRINRELGQSESQAPGQTCNCGSDPLPESYSREDHEYDIRVIDTSSSGRSRCKKKKA